MTSSISSIGLLCSFITYEVQAQNFNRRLDVLTQLRPDFAWSIEELPDGRFSIIGNSPWQGDQFYSSSIYVWKMEASGQGSGVEHVVNPGYANYPGWANSSGPRSNGGFVIGGDHFMDINDCKAALFLFNGSGVLDTMYTYGGQNETWIGRQAKQILDGGYVLCGDVNVTNGNGFLLRTDSAGELLWAREYGGSSTDYMVSVDLVGTGFYLGGMYRNVPSNYQIWTIRVDQDGEIIWERRWGGPFNDSNGHVQTTSDGHVLVAGNWPTAAGTYSNSYIFMAKLDSSNGASIWENRYGPATINTTLFAVKEITPFGDLIATGQTTPEVLEEYGVLLRTAANGDSLWMRYYQYSDSLISGGAGQLRDVLPTPDGGFIAVGAAYGVSQNGQSYGQDAWVIKVDSMGCLEPGCNLITGMESQVTNLKGALTVAPNPMRVGEAVQLSIHLPPSITPQGPLRLTVVSSDGRLVQEQHFAPHSSELTLHTSFAPGLYHLHISDATRWLAGAKVVVE